MKAVRWKKWNYSGERFVKEVGFKPTVKFTVGLKPTSFTNLSLLCGYILRLPTEGWPGWVDLDDGLNRPNRDSLLAGLYVFRPIFCSISNMDALLLWKTNRNSYALFESNGAIFSDLEWRLSSPNHLIFYTLCRLSYLRNQDFMFCRWVDCSKSWPWWQITDHSWPIVFNFGASVVSL